MKERRKVKNRGYKTTTSTTNLETRPRFFSLLFSLTRTRLIFLTYLWIFTTMTTTTTTTTMGQGVGGLNIVTQDSIINFRDSGSGFTTPRPVTTTDVLYQRFAIEPMDQSAVVGTKVTLPCRVLNQKGPIQWTKDDFGLGATRNLTGYERYAMIGSDEEGKLTFFFLPF